MHSWNITKLTGKILKVDLTSKEILITEREEEIYRNFLGSRGLNQLLFYENVKPGVSPLDSQNVLLFGAGLLTGTSAPGAIRLSIKVI